MFISIVVGLGVDYGTYFLFRYEEDIFLGRNSARRSSDRRPGPDPPSCSARSPRPAPSTCLLTDFHGIQEFGFIAGSAIMLSWLGMMTFFPAVPCSWTATTPTRRRDQKPRALSSSGSGCPLLEVTRYPVTVLAAAAAAPRPPASRCRGCASTTTC